MGYSVQSVGQWQTWTPTFTGFSADPTNVNARYSVNGKMCTVICEMTAGTSNATSFTLTLPFTAGTVRVFAPVQVQNNGTIQTGAGRVFTTIGSNVLTVNLTLAGGNFTSSGTKAVWFTFTYEIQ